MSPQKSFFLWSHESTFLDACLRQSVKPVATVYSTPMRNDAIQGASLVRVTLWGPLCFNSISNYYSHNSKRAHPNIHNNKVSAPRFSSSQGVGTPSSVVWALSLLLVHATWGESGKSTHTQTQRERKKEILCISHSHYYFSLPLLFLSVGLTLPFTHIWLNWRPKVKAHVRYTKIRARSCCNMDDGSLCRVSSFCKMCTEQHYSTPFPRSRLSGSQKRRKIGFASGVGPIISKEEIHASNVQHLGMSQKLGKREVMKCAPTLPTLFFCVAWMYWARRRVCYKGSNMLVVICPSDQCALGGTLLPTRQGESAILNWTQC